MARARQILDTSVLIAGWRRPRSAAPVDAGEARARAERTIALYRTDAIVMPVLIEFVAGTRSAEELRLAHEFLAGFRLVDDGTILPDDWALARRLAERVPRDGRPRHLGDCLIRAIARRLKHDVISLDLAFPR